MKIKNTSAVVSAEPGKLRSQLQPRRNNKDKENQMLSANKPKTRGNQKDKSAFGVDITKKNNQINPRGDKLTANQQFPSVTLPEFLKKRSQFNSQILPYVNSIIEYIISTFNSKQFTQKFKSSIKGKKSNRRAIIARLYIFYKQNKLRRKTLYLAIYYFDKYIKLTSEKDLIKMVQISEACLLISMKYEEIYPPSLEKWATGREKSIILWEAKILKLLDFNLAYTTPQHYLEIYQGKNPQNSPKECKLHQIILDLYLFTGFTYDDHPLKLVQQITESFRSTAFMQKGTVYQQSDNFVRQLILNNQQTWNFLIQTEVKYKKG